MDMPFLPLNSLRKYSTFVFLSIFAEHSDHGCDEGNGNGMRSRGCSNDWEGS